MGIEPMYLTVASEIQVEGTISFCERSAGHTLDTSPIDTRPGWTVN